MFKFSKLLSWILSGIMIVWIIYSLYWFVADSAITKEELIYEIVAIVIVIITLVTLTRIRGLKLNEPESFKGKMNLKNAVLTIANSIAGAAFFLATFLRAGAFFAAFLGAFLAFLVAIVIFNLP